MEWSRGEVEWSRGVVEGYSGVVEWSSEVVKHQFICTDFGRIYPSLYINFP